MTYWKEKCFAVSAEALVDLAVELRACGGIYGGNNRATEFLCLTLKLLQIQPEKEIILEFIKNEDHKYVRLLGAFYMRLNRIRKSLLHCIEENLPKEGLA